MPNNHIGFTDYWTYDTVTGSITTTNANSTNFVYYNDIQWDNIYIPEVSKKKVIKPYGIVAFLEKLNAKKI